MIGASASFKATRVLIDKIARCDAPVLIEGETGTGKELAARAIHYGSERANHAFIPINCGAIPDALIENELFGHAQGAFTDARRDHVGLIEHARGGTLFLDEIDALTPKAQVTLLRFLQDQQYRPLGGGQTRIADARIISASNAVLDDLAQQGAFRLDLLYRLKIMVLNLPPLREREGDAALLANHFLRQCAERFPQGTRRLHEDTLAWIARHSWPGNVRELENLIYREYLLADGPVIHISAPEKDQPERRQGMDRRRAELTELCFNKAKNRAIAEFERAYLTHVLSNAGGNVTRAASLVGKERRAFGKLMKKHGIDRTHFLN